MIQTIRLLLEYKVYPVWLLDENGATVDTKLPEEWQDDLELDRLLSEIMDLYSSLFIDTPVEFRFAGFKNEDEKSKFIELALKAVDLIVRKNSGKYQIINDFHLEEM